MKLSKAQSDLFRLMKSSSIGLISITDPKLEGIAYQLSLKGLCSKREIKEFIFTGNVSYWSLTSKGWDHTLPKLQD